MAVQKFSEIGTPRQFKQPSRKGKKAWRKNVDITEIQEGLESLREEITQGGPVAERPSEEIFSRDVVGSETTRSSAHPQRLLKADQIIGHRSAVPAVDSRKRPYSRVTDGVLEDVQNKRRSNWVGKKEVQRVKNALNDRLLLTSGRLENDETIDFDLWDGKDPSIILDATRIQHVPTPRAKVAPSTIRRAPIAMTTDGKHVRAVKTPTAGTSYNPAFEDWESLLRIEGQKELLAEQSRLDQEHIEAEKQARIAASAAEEELGARTDEESAWEGFDTNDEEADGPSKKLPKRKTPVERNKAKRRKAAERLLKHNKSVTSKEKQKVDPDMVVLAPQDLQNDLEVGVSEVQSDSEEDGDDTKLRRRKFGNGRIPDKPLELVLPDELQDSLRRLRPEGNLLNDRFRNLLVNGKVDSRKPILQAKKKKRTVTEKWSYKDFSIKV